MSAPATHLEALRRFPFDTVITPYNYRLSKEEPYRRDFDALAEAIVEQDIGLRLIKAVARNLWKTSEAVRYSTWYEPLDEQRHVDAAVAFALARSEATGLCTAGDVRLLPLMIEAERRWRSLSEEEVRAELSSVEDYEPPFVRVEGRQIPDWLEPLVPG